MQCGSVRYLKIFASSLLVLMSVSCMTVYVKPLEEKPAKQDSSEQEPSKKEASLPEGLKKWEDIFKEGEFIDGFLKFYLKRDRKVFLELNPNQLDVDFGMTLHISKGVNEFGIQQGLPLSDAMLVRFKRIGDTVQLVQMNYQLVAKEGTPMKTSLDGNIGHSILAAFKVVCEHKETKNIGLEVTPFFIWDYAGLGNFLSQSVYGKPAGLDASRSYVEKILNFPKNTEVDVIQTFKSEDYPKSFGGGLSDPRVVPIGIRYSLYALPEKPMQGRLADDRIGHFITAVYDFSKDREETSFVRYIERWRLEKKDHTQAVSEPVQPIVYYIDRSVPREYRKYVKEGIEAWNKAFEKAGFKNAVIVKEAPDNDPTWSAEDMRYSTVRWIASQDMGYAIGPSQKDPRTGEILNADVLISSIFTRSWLYEYQEMIAPDQVMKMFGGNERPEFVPPRLRSRMCFAQYGMAHQLQFQYLYLLASRLIAGRDLPEEILGDGIRELVMHEVGHTLGLRHNFKSSSAIPFEMLHDTSFTQKNGVCASVMDYAPVNIAADPEKQGHFWNKQIGAYDYWAIQYAYAPIYKEGAHEPLAMRGIPCESSGDELAGLRKIIMSKAGDPLLEYGTDEDNWLGPYALDPRISAWELGSDTLKFVAERARLCDRIMPHLEKKLISAGDGYQRFKTGFFRLLKDKAYAHFTLVKFVGGVYTSRDHKGDPAGRMPFESVPASKQREAVNMIVKYAFSRDSLRFDPEVLNKLAPNRWAHWGVDWFSFPLDFPVHTVTASIQKDFLSSLFHPVRMERMIDNEFRGGPDQYTLAELFTTFTDAVWSDLGGNINSFRRNLQKIHLNLLSDIALSDGFYSGVPEDAKTLARSALKQLASKIEQTRGSPVDAMTSAHLEECSAIITKTLDAAIVKPDK